MIRRTLLTLLGFMAIIIVASAQGPLPPSLRDVGLDQRLNEQVPLDLAFCDESGQSVKLGDYFGEKPVILVLAYYRCPMLCTQVLNGLVDGLRAVSLKPGESFQVVIVSFDRREGPELAAAKKASYLESYGQPQTAPAWHFLTGQQEAIDRLTKAVGFRYVYDSARDQFAHASGIMILTPTGRLARYFYGINFPPRDLRLGLVEASEGKIGSPVDQTLLLCYQYDPTTGKYTPAVMGFVRLGGILTLLVLGCFLLRAWWKGSQGDKETRRQGDKETRRQGDKEKPLPLT